MPALPSPRPAVPGMISRLAAYVIDLFAMALACIFWTEIIQLSVSFFSIDAFPMGRRIAHVATEAVIVMIVALYLPLSWALTGRSLGKAVLGLAIVRTDRPGLDPLGNTRWGGGIGLARSFLRFAGYWLSTLPFGLGFLWAITDEQHRGLHDRLAGTSVVYQSARRRTGSSR